MRNTIALYLFLFVPVALAARQEITFQNIVLHSAKQAEVSCLAVQCDIFLKETYNQRLLAGDSAEAYFVEVWLKDSAEYIKASRGFTEFTDSIGRLKMQVPLYLVYDAKLYGAFTVYIPYAAMQIGSGLQKIKPVIKVVDRAGKIMVPGFGGNYSTMEVPHKIDLRLAVKSITVAEKDANGKNWDLHLTNPEGAKPEVYWALKYAGKQISRSQYELNNFEFTDAEGKYTFDFAVSAEDIFYIEVLDYDVTSFSDKIGSHKINLQELEALNGADVTINFDYVRKMIFSLTVF
ncbi:MAG: hypothetical protein KIS94_11890 [Chitinophagales bacterium]|nr:hypothetical protein [Chitinophagales bacterium]